MNVLSGVYPSWIPTKAISFITEKYVSSMILKQSEAKGIVIIHQELALMPYMTIGENMFLGNERGKKAAINWDETYGHGRKIYETGRSYRVLQNTDQRHR